MGLGCVLVFYGIALVAVAIAGIFLLLKIADRTGDPRRRSRVVKWFFIAVPATTAYGVLALSAYWASCETRGVDPGIGDSFEVPLAGGYSLMFIDTLSKASVEPPSRAKWPEITDVTAVGEAGAYIFGAAAGGAFLVDTRTGQVESLRSREALTARLIALGLPPDRIRPPSDVYSSKRWTWTDVIIPALFAVPGSVLLLGTFLVAWFGIRLRSVSRAPA